MKRILASIALCLAASSFSHGMDPHANLYDEHYAVQTNANKNFTPVPKGQPGYDTMRANYTVISDQNRQVFRRGGYKTITGMNLTKQDLGIAESIKGSVKLKGNAIPKATATGKPRLNKISIKEQDTFEAAIEISHNCNFKAKIAVLNFANKDTAGGGYLHGANAQEEDLSRRSTLYPILANHKEKKGDYSIKHDELIYTPKVKIIRGSYKEGFKFLDKPYTCDVITQAAYNRNKDHGKGFENISEQDFLAGMANKIRYQLRTAADRGCGSVVVGAFGCGAFKNDPNTVANLYLTVLQENEFQNVFNEVRFAILGQTNLNAFKTGLQTLPNLQIL